MAINAPAHPFGGTTVGPRPFASGASVVAAAGMLLASLAMTAAPVLAHPVSQPAAFVLCILSAALLANFHEQRYYLNCATWYQSSNSTGQAVDGLRRRLRFL